MNVKSLPLALFILVACFSGAIAQENRVVEVYCSLDQEFSAQILDDFEAETGIKVNAVYDLEANKTIGLVNRIIAERENKNPRCDVYWNNELAQTIRLKNLGHVQPYVSPNAATIPERFKDAEGYWTGFAARARVIIYNTDMLSEAEAPTRLDALLDPQWDGKMGMAKPLTGTTLTHVAALFSVWGVERGKEWIKKLRDRGIRWERGNAMTMREVGNGSYAWGYTDTDDANVSKIKDRPTAIIVPDQGEGEMGTLLIPNSLMIVKDAKNLAEARELVDYLLRPEVETKLAESRSAQIPLHEGLESPEGVLSLSSVKTMDVNWDDVAVMIEEQGEWLINEFEGGGEEPGEKASQVLWVVLGAALALIVFLIVRRQLR